MRQSLLPVLSAVVVALSGCAMAESKLYTDPVPLPATPPREEATAGAIASPGQNLALFEDTKAHNIGDLITIKLVESTASSKSATTDSSKADNVTLANASVFGKTLHTNSGVSSSRTFKGAGDSAQSNSLTGSITVAVMQRLANGNLLVSGEKQVELNQGMEFVKIEGIVRPSDVGSDNSVTSDRVANARISYTGKGQLADANSQGWLTRFFSSPLFPF